MLGIWLTKLYVFLMILMGIFSLQSLVLVLLYLRHARQRTPEPAPPEIWPAVTVQLPVYNEQFVIERLIDAVCGLDYPPAQLSIQVLDDSTDETTHLAETRAEWHRKRGAQIEVLHRTDRTGFKAGALAEGLRCVPGELIAIFDADFIPPADFLKRTVPYLAADPKLGMVQTRWGHLNPGQNLLTRAQALSLDGHFIIIQIARSRSGLFFNFNGSGGVWRRSAIEESGGWQSDSLTEDLDLSYRAQIKGWKMRYLPDVIVPAEVPLQVAAFKQQQYRWACGGTQSLMRLGLHLWRVPLTLPQRILGTMHLASYLVHPLMLLYLLLSLPLALLPQVKLPSLWWLVPVGYGPILLVFLSQWRIYPDWPRRLAYFPVQALLSIGLGLNNSLAVIAAIVRRPGEFKRTPKYNLPHLRKDRHDNPYHLKLNWTVWGELFLSGYALLVLLVQPAWLRELSLALAIIALGYAFIGLTGLWQGLRQGE